MEKSIAKKIRVAAKIILTETLGYHYHITMHQKYDIALRDILKDMPRTFLRLLTGYATGKFLDVQFPDIQARRPDILFKVVVRRKIFQIEIQSRNEKIMLERMFLYAAFIYNQYKILPL
ncbi:hypothetical protein MBAV_004024, partial [Candidatus Magnetobacterium bavaricum]